MEQIKRDNYLKCYNSFLYLRKKNCQNDKFKNGEREERRA